MSAIMVNLVRPDVRVKIKNLANVKQADVFVQSLLYGQVGLLVLFRVVSDKHNISKSLSYSTTIGKLLHIICQLRFCLYFGLLAFSRTLIYLIIHSEAPHDISFVFLEMKKCWLIH